MSCDIFQGHRKFDNLSMLKWKGILMKTLHICLKKIKIIPSASSNTIMEVLIRMLKFDCSTVNIITFKSYSWQQASKYVSIGEIYFDIDSIDLCRVWQCNKSRGLPLEINRKEIIMVKINFLSHKSPVGILARDLQVSRHIEVIYLQ